MKKIIIIVIVLYFQVNVHSSILLDFPHYNSRLYGTGESMLLERNDINNIDVFPASISEIKGQALSMGYIKWTDMVNIMRIVYVHNMGNIGVLGGSINYSYLKEIKNHDEYGNFLGNLDNSDILINLGFGRTFNNIHIGLNIKYLNINLGGYKASWVGAGFSCMMPMRLKSINIKHRKNLNIGAGIQNINIIKPKFDKEHTTYPMILLGGFTYKFFKFFDIETKLGITGSYLTEYDKFYLSTGLEFGYKDLLYLRSGYYILGRDLDKIAVGIGINKSDVKEIESLGMVGIKFDYSLSFLQEEISHFVQLSFVLTPSIQYKKGDINYYTKKKIITVEEKHEVLFNIMEKDISLFHSKKNKLSQTGKRIMTHIADSIKKEDYKRVIVLIGIKQKKTQDLIVFKSRAKTIWQYLIDQEIDKKRISYKVYKQKYIIGEKDYREGYKILLIRWKEGEEEKFKYHYFSGLDAFIKEGYGQAIREWEDALIIDPENDEVKRRIKEAKKQLKLKRMRNR